MQRAIDDRESTELEEEGEESERKHVHHYIRPAASRPTKVEGSQGPDLFKFVTRSFATPGIRV